MSLSSSLRILLGQQSCTWVRPPGFPRSVCSALFLKFSNLQPDRTWWRLGSDRFRSSPLVCNLEAAFCLWRSTPQVRRWCCWQAIQQPLVGVLLSRLILCHPKWGASPLQPQFWPSSWSARTRLPPYPKGSPWLGRSWRAKARTRASPCRWMKRHGWRIAPAICDGVVAHFFDVNLRKYQQVFRDRLKSRCYKQKNTSSVYNNCIALTERWVLALNDFV